MTAIWSTHFLLKFRQPIGCETKAFVCVMLRRGICKFSDLNWASYLPSHLQISLSCILFKAANDHFDGHFLHSGSRPEVIDALLQPFPFCTRWSGWHLGHTEPCLHLDVHVLTGFQHLAPLSLLFNHISTSAATAVFNQEPPRQPNANYNGVLAVLLVGEAPSSFSSQILWSFLALLQGRRSMVERWWKKNPGLMVFGVI